MKSGFTVDTIKEVLKDTPFNASEITFVEEGVSTDVFKLLFDNKVYYLRILPSYRNIEFEVLAHKLILEKTPNIPKICLHKNNVKQFNNLSFMIVTEIKGKSVKSDLDLTHNQKKTISIECGRDIALINSIKVKGVGRLEKIEYGMLVAKSNNYQEFILKNVEAMVNDIILSNALDAKLAKSSAEYIFKNSNLLDVVGNSYLAHGDFGIDHIYELDGKYTGIIDFGDIKGTTRFHDLSFIYTNDRDYFDYFVEGYNQVSKLPSDYLSRIKVEALLFAIGKLWFVAKEQPERLKTHPIYGFFKGVDFV